MVAIAKTQAQHAADLAALTAAHSLNGNATSNYNQSCSHNQRAESLDL